MAEPTNQGTPDWQAAQIRAVSHITPTVFSEDITMPSPEAGYAYEEVSGEGGERIVSVYILRSDMSTIG
jgi:hypothetical protein